MFLRTALRIRYLPIGKRKKKFSKKANTKCTAEKSAVHFVCNKNIQGRKFAHMDLFKHIDKKQFSGVLIVFFHT